MWNFFIAAVACVAEFDQYLSNLYTTESNAYNAYKIYI